MRSSQVSHFIGFYCLIANFLHRIPAVLLGCCWIYCGHDLQSRSPLWPKEPAGLHLHLLHGRIDFGDVCEGIWHCIEVDFCWQKSIFAPIYLRLHDRNCCLHSHADELLQQGSESIPDINVSSESRVSNLLVSHVVIVSIRCTMLHSLRPLCAPHSSSLVVSTPLMRSTRYLSSLASLSSSLVSTY